MNAAAKITTPCAALIARRLPHSLGAASAPTRDADPRRDDLPLPLPRRSLAGEAGQGRARWSVAGAGDTVRGVLTSGDPRVNAGEIISQVCSLLGGKGGGKQAMAQGGGPDANQLDLALKVGRERIIAALHG